MNEITTMSTRVPAMPESGQFLEIISRAASDPNVDVAKMEALLNMQERIVAKQAEALFNQAYARLAKTLPVIKKGGVVSYEDKKGNPKPAFTFAKWEDIAAAIRPQLEAEGFSLSFNSQPKDGGGIVVTGTLRHEAGHSVSASIPLALDSSGGKNNLQGMGSTFSYGKRYTTTMLLNLVFEGEDDDGARGGMVFITPEQVQEIAKGLHETKSDAASFLDFMEAGSIEGIQAKDYPKALNAIAAKRRKMRLVPEQHP